MEYTFKHALTQEVAKNSMLTELRGVLHERTAQAIEALYPTRLKEYCSELAHHYSQSGNVPKAVEYLHCAGQQAFQRSASLEAIRHLGSALELLKRLPDTPERAEQELALQLAVGPALMAARGYAAPEVEAPYTRALALCEQVREASQLFPALLGLRTYYQLRAEYATARELGERLLRMAQSTRDSALLVEAHSALGATLFFQGDLATALAHHEQALALYWPGLHHTHAFVSGLDPGIRSLTFVAWILWYQGHADQAGKPGQEALALARKMSHPFGLVHCLVFMAELHQFRRDAQQTRESAEAMWLATEQGLPFWLAWAPILRGWALAVQGNSEDGIAQIRQGLAAYRATGAERERSYFLALLAECYGNAGQADAGLNVLDEAMAIVDRTGERFHEAELHRLKGELMLHASGMEGDPSAHAGEAEACFHKAIAVARHQGAKSLELRATLSLAQLWQRQGKAEAARQHLAEICAAFTEGLATTDLPLARALLDELP